MLLALFVSPLARADRATAPAIVIGGAAQPGFPDVIGPAIQWIAQVFHNLREVTQFTPDPNHATNPDDFENLAKAVALRLGQSRFQLLAQGGGNLRYLGRQYFYNATQGGMGIQFDFISPDQPESKIAIRLLPLYGEIAWIRTGWGTIAPSNLPSIITFGPAVEFEASRRLGRLETGIHINLRADFDAGDTKTRGVASLESVYLKFPLNDLLGDRFHMLGPVNLTTTLTHFERSAAQESLFHWAREAGDILAMRQGWEGTVFLNMDF